MDYFIYSPLHFLCSATLWLAGFRKWKDFGKACSGQPATQNRARADHQREQNQKQYFQFNKLSNFNHRECSGRLAGISSSPIRLCYVASLLFMMKLVDIFVLCSVLPFRSLRLRAPTLPRRHSGSEHMFKRCWSHWKSHRKQSATHTVRLYGAQLKQFMGTPCSPSPFMENMSTHNSVLPDSLYNSLSSCRRSCPHPVYEISHKNKFNLQLYIF